MILDDIFSLLQTYLNDETISSVIIDFCLMCDRHEKNCRGNMYIAKECLAMFCDNSSSDEPNYFHPSDECKPQAFYNCPCIGGMHQCSVCGEFMLSTSKGTSYYINSYEGRIVCFDCEDDDMSQECMFCGKSDVACNMKKFYRNKRFYHMCLACVCIIQHF